MLIFIIIASFVSLFFGMTTLTLTAFTYWKKRNRLLLSFMVFFGLLTFHMIFEAVINYIYLNNYSFYIDSFTTLHLISLLFSYSVFFTFILFTNIIIGYKKLLLISISVAIVLLIIFPFDFTAFDYINSDGEYQIKTFKDLSWADYFHLLPFLYPITILFKVKRIKENKDSFWLGKKLGIITLFSIPVYINDILRVFIFNLSFTPLLYIVLSLLLLFYLMKFYHTKKVITVDNLSKREKEIAEFIIEGYSNSDISEKLHISSSTVKNHVYNIYKKLNIKNRYELIKKTSI